MVYLLLYVNNIIPHHFQHNTSVAHHICPQARIHHDGPQTPPSISGVPIHHQVGILFLTQRQYALDMFEHAGMVDCKTLLMYVDTHDKVSTDSVA
jgi:hypothetical protein